jgi:hypothetical protein
MVLVANHPLINHKTTPDLYLINVLADALLAPKTGFDRVVSESQPFKEYQAECN